MSKLLISSLGNFTLVFLSPYLDGKHHTIHLHGHDFVVLKTEYPDYNDTTGYMNGHNKDLECPDERMCRKMKWANDEHLTLKPDNRPLTVTRIKNTAQTTICLKYQLKPNRIQFWCLMEATQW